METAFQPNRREVLKLAGGFIGGLGFSLLAPSLAYAKSPSQLCPSHFRGRTDMQLSMHFNRIEDSWNNAMQTGRYNGRRLFFEDPDLGGLITAMEEEKWISLTDNYQERTRRVWPRHKKDFRQFVCHVYQNPYDDYYNSFLNEDKKSDFRRFVKAYRYAIDNFDEPEQEMFRTRDGSVHNTYQNGYPWLCISFPDVCDRALIFNQEVFHQDKGRRIDWNNVRKYSERYIERHSEGYSERYREE